MNYSQLKTQARAIACFELMEPDTLDLMCDLFDAAESEADLNPFNRDAQSTNEDRLAIVEGWAYMDAKQCQQVDTYGADTVLQAQGIIIRLLRR